MKDIGWGLDALEWGMAREPEWGAADTLDWR